MTVPNEIITTQWSKVLLVRKSEEIAWSRERWTGGGDVTMADDVVYFETCPEGYTMASWHEELNSDLRTFQVKFKDGSEVLHKVTWHGVMDAHVEEGGGPATWTHPIDDRRCSWGASGAILRQVAVVIAGQEYVNQKLTAVYNANSENVGSSFVVTNLRPENCNDSQARRDSDFQNMRNTINGMLQKVIQSDLPLVQNAIKQSGEVVEVKEIKL
jgi:hypothetical protein